jgi:hypothetical protein
MISVTSSPPNARRPTNISNSTQPNDHTSVRSSTGLPLACSGDMYAAVPRTMPCMVPAGDVSVGEFIGSAVGSLTRPVASIALASPKSRTFTVPSGRTLMFAGFRSRWMIP